MRTATKKYVTLFAALTGFMAGTIYWPTIPPVVLLFAPWPLWCLWLHPNINRTLAFFTGWVFQFAATLLACHWIFAAIRAYWGFSDLASLVLFILSCAGSSIYVPLAGAFSVSIRDRLQDRLAMRVFFFAVIIAFADVFLPKPIPFNVSYAWMWSGLPLIQVADTLGMDGLGVLTYFLSASLLLAWKLRARHPFKAAAFFMLFLSVFGAVNLVGWWKEESVEDEERRLLRVMLVQPNAMNDGDPEAIARLGQWMKANSEGADVAVLPESALPLYVDGDQPPSPALVEFARRMPFPIVAGAYARSSRGDVHNSVIVMHKGRQRVVFHKNRLFPFGEYAPLGLVGKDAFAPGTDAQPFEAAGALWGPSICFEGLISHHFRRQAAAGAEIFVNLTNDIWFSSWDLSQLHSEATRARAIEFRRPLIRVNNNGPSSVITALGKELVHSPFGVRWSKTVELAWSPHPRKTFFERWGSALPILGVVSFYFAVFLAFDRVGDALNRKRATAP